MRRYALVLSGILLIASCGTGGTVRNLGSYKLEDPNLFATLRIAGYFTVTSIDAENVSWPGSSRLSRFNKDGLLFNQDKFAAYTAETYAEVRIGPGLHHLHVEFQLGPLISAALPISHYFRAGGTYLLSAIIGKTGTGWVKNFTVKPEMTALAHDTSSDDAPSTVGKHPRTGTTYTVAGGVVYDAKTKLSWQQIISSTMYTWADAKTYCAGVGTSLGGAGWRLPTIEELKTIVDDTHANPAIDPTAFPVTPVDRFWSSSPVARSPSNAWAVYFDSGQSYSFNVSLTSHVRCVR